MHVVCGPGDETAVVVDHPQEPLQLLDRRGLRKISDGGDSLRQRRYAVLVHVIPKEFEGIFSQHALFAAYDQTIFTKVVEACLHILEMLLLSLTSDQEIINVNEDERNFAKYGIHKPLEILARVL